MATLTIKSRPLADGKVSWFLYVRRPRPEQDELIPVPQYTSASDRVAVETFAALYREELGADEAKSETCDEWYDRFILTRMGKVSTASRDHAQWLKWISPHIGKRAITSITADDVETVRDALNDEIDKWERA